MYRQTARQQYEYPPQQGYQQHPPDHANGPQAQQQQQPQSGYQQGSRNLYNPNAFGQQQPPPPQQYQQQPQQQQQQGANGAGGNVANGSASGDNQSQANSGPAGQEMNLASVLHYLQSEWRRWERDRNEWEIERAEMRARIALLEGQRRSAENLKVDLLRRVKMLEYALRQERTKTVSSAGKSTVAPSRLSTLQDEDKMREEKEGSGSEGSEEGTQDRPKANGNGIHPAAISNAGSTIASRTSDSPWKSIGTASKDPKARARSREYLKQCLQEITYLTSPGALNPLPARPPANLEIDPSQSGPSLDAESSKLPDRPRKTIPDLDPPPSLLPKDLTAPPTSVPAPAPIPDKTDIPPTADKAEPSSLPTPLIVTPPPAPPAEQPPPPTPSSGTSSSLSVSAGIDPSARPPSSPATHTVGLPLDDEPEPESEPAPSAGAAGDTQVLTAIYRPESKAAWKEELRAANEQAEKARQRSSSVSSSAASESGQPTDEEQLQSLSLNVPDEDTSGDAESQVEKSWTSRKVLKSHLHIVRAVAFAQGPGIMLASAGDDCTVKVWHMEAGAIMSPKPNSNELEPIMTYRTHTAPITSLVISSPLSTIFSASLDCTILAWRLPPPSADPYAPHDPSNLLQVLEGHTDAVWDLCLVPSRLTPTDHSAANTVKAPSAKKAKTSASAPRLLLVSASADGSVKVWEHQKDARQWALKRSVAFDGAGPTCLGAFAIEAGKVLVGFTDGRVGLVDVEDGGEVVYYGEASEGELFFEFGDGADGAGGAKQVNAVLCHPTWPVVLVGYEDGYIRFFHARTPGPTAYHEIRAHPDAITALTLSPQHPHGLLSAAADCSIRVWDLDKKTSVQDCAGHRQRAGEGVVGLARHAELPVVASAGADGVVRVWSAA